MPTALFAWRRTPPPFLIGGAEVTQQLLAEELAAAGWHVTYLGSHEAPWDGATQLPPDMRAHLDQHHVPYDEADGTLRYRWNGVECAAFMQNNVEHALGSLLGDLSPDVVFTSQEGSAQLAAQARPTALVAGLLHSVSVTGLGSSRPTPLRPRPVSDFVRARAPHTPGTRLVVMYPPFALPGEGSGEGRTASVLMINPCPRQGIRATAPTPPVYAGTALHLGRRLVGHGRRLRRLPERDVRAPRVRHGASVPQPSRAAGPIHRGRRFRVIVEAALHGVRASGPTGAASPKPSATPESSCRAQPLRDVGKRDPGAGPRGAGHEGRRQAVTFTRPCLPELRELGI